MYMLCILQYIDFHTSIARRFSINLLPNKPPLECLCFRSPILRRVRLIHPLPPSPFWRPKSRPHVAGVPMPWARGSGPRSLMPRATPICLVRNSASPNPAATRVMCFTATRAGCSRSSPSFGRRPSSARAHAHHTWCGYAVYENPLHETLFRFDPAQGKAEPVRTEVRVPGYSCYAGAGLDQIHRLGNSGPRPAISIHAYGVERERIATHVNRVVDVAP